MFTDHVNPDFGSGCNTPKAAPGDYVMTGNNWSPTYQRGGSGNLNSGISGLPA